MHPRNKQDITGAFEWRQRSKTLKDNGYYEMELSEDHKIVIEPNPKGGVYAAVYRGTELIADKLPGIRRVKRRPR